MERNYNSKYVLAEDNYQGLQEVPVNESAKVKLVLKTVFYFHTLFQHSHSKNFRLPNF